MGSSEVKGVGEEFRGFLREIRVCVSTPGVPRPKNQKNLHYMRRWNLSRETMDS